MIYKPNKPNLFAQLRTGHWSTNGLVGYYPFTRAGNLVDFSPNGNHGVITGATWSGEGLGFDGNDYVTIPHNPSLNVTIPYSISVTVSQTTDNNLVIFEKNGNNGISLQQAGPGTHRLSLWSGHTDRPPAAGWSHVVRRGP